MEIRQIFKVLSLRISTIKTLSSSVRVFRPVQRRQRLTTRGVQQQKHEENGRKALSNPASVYCTLLLVLVAEFNGFSSKAAT